MSSETARVALVQTTETPHSKRASRSSGETSIGAVRRVTMVKRLPLRSAQ